jgi:hypothetical protein
VFVRTVSDTNGQDMSVVVGGVMCLSGLSPILMARTYSRRPFNLVLMINNVKQLLLLVT